jgi:hypothetical protein
MPSGTKIKVWITADNDNSLRVLPASGLAVRDTAGHRYTVPTGAKYTSWRIRRSGAGYRLGYRTSSGSYVTKSTGLTSGTWRFTTRSKIVKVVLPNGSVRPYRGVSLTESGGRTINVLLEDYALGCGAGRNARDLADQRGTGAGGRGAVVRGPAAEIRRVLRVRHL